MLFFMKRYSQLIVIQNLEYFLNHKNVTLTINHLSLELHLYDFFAHWSSSLDCY